MTARILVVDDVAANLKLLEARLSAEYYEVAVASSGQEALRVAATWSPDVVLLDVMMPEMDGYEVCRQLKLSPATAHVPVVMITALVDQAERVRGLEAGADDFLSKPVDHATLFARVRALLRTKQVLDAFRLRAETARDLGFEPMPDPAKSVAGARALVATEDDAEAVSLAAILGEDGIAVVRAADAATAWDRLTREEYDLAVLSLWLDDGEGLRLASRMRAQTAMREVPVLLVADLDQMGQVLGGFYIGANDHVLRPVDPNELRARARNQIRRKRYQERLRADLQRSLEMAVTDSLTGLRNRRYVMRHLEGLLRSGGATVLLIDVDHFKKVNDTYGHAFGDAVLKDVADRLRLHLRAVDVVARYGGEEFIVTMAPQPPDDASSVAGRLRRAISNTPTRVADREIGVTISIGVAVAVSDATAESLCAAADVALYRAKAGGRDRVEVAQPGDWHRP